MTPTANGLVAARRTLVRNSRKARTLKTYCKGLKITEALVLEAYSMWGSGEAGRKNEWRVERDYGPPDALCAEIAAQIETRSLSTPSIGYRTRREPNNGKVREIAVESVKQQVMDYTAYLCLKPLIEAKMGYYQTASVKGKGQLFAKRHIAKWFGACRYWVKLDVRKCYPSISRDVCMRILRRYVRSDDVLYLCDYLLSTYRRGLNIGSFFALEMANLVLSFAYHHIESLHAERRGEFHLLVAHQLWFMDDCLLLGNSKRDLKRAVRSLSAFMRGELGLELKPWKVSRTSCEAMTMCGYTFRPGRVTVGEGTFLRAKRCFARFYRKPIPKLARRACSYNGWFCHSMCHSFMRKHGVYRAVGIARAVVSAADRRTQCA